MHLGQQVEQRRLLFSGRLEERGDVPFRDDQAMAGGVGEAVVEGYSVSVGQDDLGFVRIAEGASGLFVHVILHRGSVPHIALLFGMPKCQTSVASLRPSS